MRLHIALGQIRDAVARLQIESFADEFHPIALWFVERFEACGKDEVVGGAGEGNVEHAFALVEFFGGLALITGLLTRLASFGLLSTMVVAILQVHLKNGFFAPTGVEFPLSLVAATAALVITGAGRFSLDSLIGRGKASTVPVDKIGLRKAA